MSHGPLGHAEYIKLKYLGGGEGKVKRKRKVTKVSGKQKQLRIYDDDVQVSKVNSDDSDIEQYGTQEEKPQVEGIVDDRPAYLKSKDVDKTKWRPFEGQESEGRIPDSKTSPPRRKRRVSSSDDDLPSQRATVSKNNPQAKTVYRDRATGRVRDPDQLQVKETPEDEEKKLRYKEWTFGLKQRQEQQQRLEENLHEMSKPLARMADDEDLDKMLRGNEVDGDPMLLYMRKKQAQERQTEAAAKGETVLETPKYRGPPAPLNRFSIQPGHRWDGVDRSSGFEKKYFLRQSEKLATRDEAYKWSTQDM